MATEQTDRILLGLRVNLWVSSAALITSAATLVLRSRHTPSAPPIEHQTR